MRLHTSLFACGLAIVLLAGCSPYVPPPVTVAQLPTQEQREMATLSFLAYLGDGLTGSDDWVETHLDHCMEEALREQDGVTPLGIGLGTRGLPFLPRQAG
jgi:hypothetical protein